MKIFPLTIYVLLKPFIQILPSDSKKSLWDSRTTATLAMAILAFSWPFEQIECCGFRTRSPKCKWRVVLDSAGNGLGGC
jgi:hypothetical protein